MTTCRIPDCGAETDGFMCRPCLRILERDLGDMQSLIEEVWRRAMGMARVYRANGRRQSDGELEAWSEEQGRIDARLRSREGRVTLPATRLMVDLDARTLLDEAWNTLVVWARHLVEARYPEEDRDRMTPPADELCSWLLGNAASFRFDEAGPVAFDELRFLHGRLERAVDRSPSRVYAGPCHAALADGARCQRPLFAWPGADQIVCDGFGVESEYDVGCQASHESDRSAWLIAELADALVPLVETLAALPRLLPDLPVVPRSVVFAWVRQGRLLARSITSGGVELFRGGDIVELAVAYRPHKFAPRRSRRSA